jgi:PAS domain S-box-containing protein
MHTDEQFKASLKEIADLKTALDEHAIVAITDPQGRINYVNDKFCAISKYSRDELLGRDHRIINSGFHPKEFIRNLWTTIGRGRVWRGEIKNRAKDGSFYWVDTTIVPFLNDDGRPRQYVAIRADITERKRAEEQLRASLKETADLKTALDEHAIVAITDPQGRINYVNDKFCAISKYSRDELLGQDHRIINSGFHPTEFIRNLWTTIGRGRVWRGEIKNRAKDGSFYWVDTTIVPFLNDDGRPRQYVAIRADITERKRAEEQLRTSLKETADLKTALDEHAIVAITDPQGRISYVNDKFCAISKFPRDELLGQDHRIINSGFHPKEFIRDLWTTIGRGRVWRGEIKNRAKDGSFYWVDTTIVPFLNDDGKPRQYVAIRADITERKHAEEKAAQLAAIVESSDDAIVGKDLRGFVTSWNMGAERLFGYSGSEMVGQSIKQLIPPGRHEEEDEILGLIGLGKSVLNFETVRLRKDGSAIDVSVTVSAIRDPSGTIVGASKLARDITDRKKAQATIEQLNAELEQRVVERTAQLEAANRELEAFSYSVSHDLRAPLRAVDGFSQAILEDFGPQLPDEGRRYLQTIRHSTQRMGALIDDLLTFARLSRQELTRRDIDTGGLVRDALDELGFPWTDRVVELKVAELPASSGDPALLKQVWLNLLGNALKYTRKREKAELEIGRVQSNGMEAFFIRDNGTGFDMRYAGKLFGVFQRLHPAEEYEGTGIGLAIVQRIVQRHGGRIWADAAVDRGATFYFTLEGDSKP